MYANGGKILLVSTKKQASEQVTLSKKQISFVNYR